MQVEGGRHAALPAAEQAFLPHRLARLTDELGVPGGGHHGRHAPCGGLAVVGRQAVAVVEADAVGALAVAAGRQTDGIDAVGEVRLGDEDLLDIVGVGVVIELVEEGFPIFVVIIFAAHVEHGEQLIRLFGDRFAVHGAPFHVAQLFVRLIIEGVFEVEHGRELFAHILIGGTGGRKGLVPVCTGEHHALFLHIFAHVREEVGRGDELCVGVFGLPFGIREQGAVVRHRRLHLYLGGTGIAVVVPDVAAVFPRLFFDDLVAVGAQGEAVLALFEEVAAGGAVAVVAGVAVGSELVFIEGKGDARALAGVDALRLAEGDEGRGRLFDQQILIDVGIGRGVVQLHHLFARHVARVGDVYRHRKGVARGEGRDLLLEGGIGEAVAEGIRHFARRHHAALPVQFAVHEAFGADVVRGLVIAVAVVHALAVFHEGRFIRIGVMELAPVIVRRGLGEVGREDIDQPARGVHFPRQDVRHRAEALVAGVARPDDGVHFQLALHDGRELHGVGGVDDEDDAAAVLFGVGDHVPFVFGEGEEVRGTVVIGVRLFIQALAAAAADKYQPGGVLHLFQFGRGDVVIDVHFQFRDLVVAAERHGVVAAGPLGAPRRVGVVFILEHLDPGAVVVLDVAAEAAVRGQAHIGGLLVGSGADDGKAVLFQRLRGADALFGLRIEDGAALLHAVVDGMGISPAERRHRLVFQGKDAVVFQQHRALVVYLLHHLLGSGHGLFEGAIALLVILRVPRFGVFGLDGVPFAPPERGIQHAAENTRQHVQRDQQSEQHRQDGDPDGEHFAVAHFELSLHIDLRLIG